MRTVGGDKRRERESAAFEELELFIHDHVVADLHAPLLQIGGELGSGARIQQHQRMSAFLQIRVNGLGFVG